MNPKAIVERLTLYERLMRLDKPIGTLLLLWPTLWALWIAAEGRPDLFLIWIFALGTLLMRSAGCVLNDYADRDFDRHVKRTMERPLTTGQVSTREALILAGCLALCAFGLIVKQNKLVWELSVAALLLAATYPYTKRFFAIPQAYLGVAFGFGIPMGFAAILAHVPSVALWMLAGNIFWAIAYDTEYAMVDRDDDLRLGLKTSAITFGKFDVAAVMLSYAVFLLIMFHVGRMMYLGPWYFGGLAAAALIAAYHYFLIRKRTREGCFAAFMHNNWLGAAIFAGIVLDYGRRLMAWPSW